jgi:hypothetical protein
MATISGLSTIGKKMIFFPAPTRGVGVRVAVSVDRGEVRTGVFVRVAVLRLGAAEVDEVCPRVVNSPTKTTNPIKNRLLNKRFWSDFIFSYAYHAPIKGHHYWPCAMDNNEQAICPDQSQPIKEIRELDYSDGLAGRIVRQWSQRRD